MNCYEYCRKKHYVNAIQYDAMLLAHDDLQKRYDAQVRLYHALQEELRVKQEGFNEIGGKYAKLRIAAGELAVMVKSGKLRHDACDSQEKPCAACNMIAKAEEVERLVGGGG